MTDSASYNNEFHNFYETAKRLADCNLSDFERKVVDITDSDERKFLMTVTSFFLQRHQEDLINKV